LPALPLKTKGRKRKLFFALHFEVKTTSSRMMEMPTTTLPCRRKAEQQIGHGFPDILKLIWPQKVAKNTKIKFQSL
jgi:uncharacterized protein YjaG (DUF416 family)